MTLAGGAKLLGAKPLADQFREFGLPKSMMYVVGLLELSAAVGVHVPELTFLAAMGVIFLMFGALANHRKAHHAFTQMLPALIGLALATTICTLTYGSMLEG